MVHQPAMEIQVGGELAGDHELAERAAHPRDRLGAVTAPYREFRDHRIVKYRHLGARVYAGVVAYAGPARPSQRVDPAWRGRETSRGILSIDAALDRPSALTQILLAKGQRRAGRDLNLRLDQVHSRDHLGYCMLDLDAGVHFEEIKIAIGVGQELDRPGAKVAHRLRGLDCDLAHRATHRGGNEGRGRLLDDFLMAALDGAFALEDVHCFACTIGKHLEFDMARAAEKLLDVQAGVAEGRLRLATNRAERRGQLGLFLDEAQTLAAAASRRLEHNRIANLR